eukprot:scaffold230824_cov30-Tisochrysis_lutea.AAC.2
MLCPVALAIISSATFRLVSTSLAYAAMASGLSKQVHIIIAPRTNRQVTSRAQQRGTAFHLDGDVRSLSPRHLPPWLVEHHGAIRQSRPVALSSWRMEASFGASVSA